LICGSLNSSGLAVYSRDPAAERFVPLRGGFRLSPAVAGISSCMIVPVYSG
jgi:hypothetical protein